MNFHDLPGVIVFCSLSLTFSVPYSNLSRTGHILAINMNAQIEGLLGGNTTNQLKTTYFNHV